MAGTASPITTVMTGNARLDALLWGKHWSSGAGTTVISTYLAGRPSGEWLDDGYGGRIWAAVPSTAELAAMAAAMDSFKAVCNVDFRTVTRAADADLVWASVGDAHAFGGMGWTNPPGTGSAFGDAQALIAVNRDAYQTGGAGLPRGSLDYATFLHQLGLALGLGHPHEGFVSLPGVDGAMGSLGDFDLNQGIFTMMSFNDGWQTAPHGTSPSPLYGYQAGPMALDIAALQSLYGANMTHRTGSDTYVLPGANQTGTGWTCIWDAGGTDRVQGAAAIANVIDLRAATLQAGPGGGGFVSHAAGIHGGLTIAHGATIEEAAGGALADHITGNAAANLLLGLDGNDTLLGLDGNDSLDGGGGNDLLEGGAGSNILQGLDGNDWLDGGAGNDRLEGGAGDDTLLGQDGDDTLDGGLGLDRLDGGLGNDIYLADGGDTIIEAADGGVDEVRAAITHTLATNVENLLLTGALVCDGIGNDLANRLLGNAAANTLLGQAGDDTLDGGSGLDRLEGGLGNDLYLLTDGDTVIEGVGAGTDEVRAAVSHTLTANVENLLLTGTLALNGTGNALANRLTGNAGNNILKGLDGADRLDGAAGIDTIEGGAGDDALKGGAGSDRLTGGLGNDSFLFAAPSDGGDLVLDFRNVAGDDDRFQISAAGFGGGLVAGTTLSAAQFRARTDNLAQDADDRFIFRSTDQTLWYDSNGNAAGGLSLVADLQTGAIVTNADLLIIA